MSRKLLSQGASLAAMVLLSGVGAFAQNQGGNLPWEGPLQTLVTSLTGPVAYAISIVAIVALGAGLAFGGEMSESMRRMLQVGIAVCLVVFAAQVMTSWIGSGAETAPASALRCGRELRAERAAAGRISAKARGKTGGRPRTDAVKLRDAKVLYENSDKTAQEVCKVFGVGRRIFFEYLAQQRELSPAQASC